MCKVCAIWVDLNPPYLGGLDPVTMEAIVEVDETKYFHHKYMRGQWHEGHWVFEGIEHVNPHNNHRAATLNPILQQFVAEGSMVNTDLWAAYNGIEQLPEGYGHTTVNHSVNFVNPNDPVAHTKGIESFWAYAKKKLKRMSNSNHELFIIYLREFEWHWQNDTFSSSGGQAFEKFLLAVTQQFVL